MRTQRHMRGVGARGRVHLVDLCWRGSWGRSIVVYVRVYDAGVLRTRSVGRRHVGGALRRRRWVVLGAGAGPGKAGFGREPGGTPARW